MARLVYAALASLDGSVADEDGRFDWAEPDAEVHAFVNDYLSYDKAAVPVWTAVGVLAAIQGLQSRQRQA